MSKPVVNGRDWRDLLLKQKERREFVRGYVQMAVLGCAATGERINSSMDVIDLAIEIFDLYDERLAGLEEVENGK